MNIDPNTSLDDAVPKESKYLQKQDVGEQGVNLTIQGFTREDVDPNNASEIKTVMHFVEPDYKPLILNQTNKNIMKSFGWMTTGAAIGKQVNVYNDPTISFGGNIVGGIRLRKAADDGKDLPF